MALTIVADSAFIVPIMFCAASRISERMASPSAVVWAFTICTVCPRFIVSIPLIVPQSQPLANVWAGIARKIVRKSSFFIFGPLFHGLFHKLRS